jgi:uncharacterized protein YndB with AHSA1/START domain
MSSKDDRPVGLTKDAGWQVGARKTLQLDLAAAWKLISEPTGLRDWLGEVPQLSAGDEFQLEDGTQGMIRVHQPQSHIRLSWQPPQWQKPSTLQVRVVGKGDKTVIAFHQENMPSQEVRENRKAFFKRALTQLASLAKG